jgi:hypothetical protein
LYHLRTAAATFLINLRAQMQVQMVDTRLRYAISGPMTTYWNMVSALRRAGS